jgi:hypothetical protein
MLRLSGIRTALEPLELLELLEQARFAQTLIAITACR